MRRIAFVLVAVVAACASPRKLVEESIEASGGTEALSGVQGYHIAVEGMHMGSPYTGVTHWDRNADAWRWDMQSDEMQMSGWVFGTDVFMSSMGAPAQRVEGRMREDWIGHKRVSNCSLLPVHLLDDDVTLEKAPAVEIDGTKHPAVRVVIPGIEPATLVFDADTHLVRQMHFMMTDETMETRVPVVMDLADYTDIGGVKVAKTLKMNWAGKSGNETRTDVRWNPDTDPSILAQPDVAPPADIAVREEAETRVVEYTHVGHFRDTGKFIEATMAWIAENGGTPAGPVAVLYRDMGEATDMEQMKHVVQVPVKMDTAPAHDSAKLLKRPAYSFCYANYAGHPAGWWGMTLQVRAWIKKNGYRVSGPERVAFLGKPDEEGNAKMEVGFPVRK